MVQATQVKTCPLYNNGRCEPMNNEEYLCRKADGSWRECATFFYIVTKLDDFALMKKQEDEYYQLGRRMQDYWQHLGARE